MHEELIDRLESKNLMYIYRLKEYGILSEIINEFLLFISSKMYSGLNINKNELFECYSAFNGLSIYKISKFINCSYDWDIINTIKYIPDDILLNNINVNKEKNINIIYNNNGFGDCEHRKFHLEAIQKNNAKIFISPLFLFN